MIRAQKIAQQVVAHMLVPPGLFDFSVFYDCRHESANCSCQEAEALFDQVREVGRERWARISKTPQKRTSGYNQRYRLSVSHRTDRIRDMTCTFTTAILCTSTHTVLRRSTTTTRYYLMATKAKDPRYLDHSSTVAGGAWKRLNTNA